MQEMNLNSASKNESISLMKSIFENKNVLALFKKYIDAEFPSNMFDQDFPINAEL